MRHAIIAALAAMPLLALPLSAAPAFRWERADLRRAGPARERMHPAPRRPGALADRGHHELPEDGARRPVLPDRPGSGLAAGERVVSRAGPRPAHA